MFNFIAMVFKKFIIGTEQVDNRMFEDDLDAYLDERMRALDGRIAELKERIEALNNREGL